MKILPTEFDGQSIRRVYDEATETWCFSVIDVVQVLTDSENARDYWFKMKIRVKSVDGAELSTVEVTSSRRQIAAHRCGQCRKLAAHRPIHPQSQS